jgi:hypothetical protein
MSKHQGNELVSALKKEWIRAYDENSSAVLAS